MPIPPDDLRATFQRERLHRAAQDGDFAAVEKWLAAGYRPNRFDSIGKTPLHYAVRENHMAVVNRLLAAGASPNAHDERWAGNTPLSDNVATMSFDMAAAAAHSRSGLPPSTDVARGDRAVAITWRSPRRGDRLTACPKDFPFDGGDACVCPPDS